MFAQHSAAARPEQFRLLTDIVDGGREHWVRQCSTRLAQLRPRHDREVLDTLAQDMWSDVASFDPEIAAEMEHESWRFDD